MTPLNFERAFRNAHGDCDFGIWNSVFVPQEQDQLVLGAQAMKVIIEFFEPGRDSLGRIKLNLFRGSEFSSQMGGVASQLLAGHTQYPSALMMLELSFCAIFFERF